MSVSLLGLMPGYPKADKGSVTQRAYVVQWLVQATAYTDGPATVIALLDGVHAPAPWTSYDFAGTEIDIYARMREWDAWRVSDNSLQWVLWARYSTAEPKAGENRGTGQGTHQDPTSITDPTLEPAVAEFTEVERDKALTRIFNVNAGRFNPPMNSACYPFTGLTYKTYDLQLTITRNENVIPGLYPALCVQYVGATNSDYFWGMTPGTWICKSIKPQNQQKNIPGTQLNFIRTQYVFQARSEGWLTYVLDAGPFYCPGGGGNSGQYSGYSGYESGSGELVPSTCPNCTNKVPFVDQHGHPITGLLNNGDRLPSGQEPNWMVFQTYQSLPYAALNLPNDLSQCQ